MNKESRHYLPIPLLVVGATRPQAGRLVTPARINIAAEKLLSARNGDMVDIRIHAYENYIGALSGMEEVNGIPFADNRWLQLHRHHVDYLGLESGDYYLCDPTTINDYTYYRLRRVTDSEIRSLCEGLDPEAG